MLIKYLFLLFFCLFFRLTFAIKPQTDSIKTGFNFAVFPTLVYDSDFGLQYGVGANLYFYGNGENYPEYKHSIYLDISRSTKGGEINRVFYDSKYLIPKMRVTADLSYLVEKAMPFYGFNGSKAVYNKNWIDEKSNEYRTRVFYCHERNIFRFKLDLQGEFMWKNLNWAAGYATYYFNVDAVNIHNFNKKKKQGNALPDTATLYDFYNDWGIISPKEKNGGKHRFIKVGLTYDSRDNQPNPMSGIWTEAMINIAPKFMGNNDFAHAKISLTHRQYFTIITNKLSFAYRLLYQTTVGKSPFYLYPFINTSYLNRATSEGVGGPKTVRGIFQNRLVGNDIAFGNFEFRWRPIKFHFLNQMFYIGTNIFLDGGIVVKDIKFDMDKVTKTIEQNHPELDIESFFSQKQQIHAGYGAGLSIAMNQNFIIAFDCARSWHYRMGRMFYYVGLNYLF